MKLYATILLSLLVVSSMFARSEATSVGDSTLADKILEICKQTAVSYLNEKVERDYGSPTDKKRKALKVSQSAKYEAEVELVNKRLAKTLKAMTTSKVQEYSDVVFAEYRQSLSDLGEDYYQQAAKKLRELN